MEAAVRDKEEPEQHKQEGCKNTVESKKECGAEGRARCKDTREEAAQSILCGQGCRNFAQSLAVHLERGVVRRPDGKPKAWRGDEKFTTNSDSTRIGLLTAQSTAVHVLYIRSHVIRAPLFAPSHPCLWATGAHLQVWLFSAQWAPSTLLRTSDQ